MTCHAVPRHQFPGDLDRKVDLTLLANRNHAIQCTIGQINLHVIQAELAVDMPIDVIFEPVPQEPVIQRK